MFLEIATTSKTTELVTIYYETTTPLNTTQTVVELVTLTPGDDSQPKPDLANERKTTTQSATGSAMPNATNERALYRKTNTLRIINKYSSYIFAVKPETREEDTSTAQPTTSRTTATPTPIIDANVHEIEVAEAPTQPPTAKADARS